MLIAFTIDTPGCIVLLKCNMYSFLNVDYKKENYHLLWVNISKMQWDTGEVLMVAILLHDIGTQ